MEATLLIVTKRPLTVGLQDRLPASCLLKILMCSYGEITKLRRRLHRVPERLCIIWISLRVKMFSKETVRLLLMCSMYSIAVETATSQPVLIFIPKVILNTGDVN